MVTADADLTAGLIGFEMKFGGCGDDGAEPEPDGGSKRKVLKPFEPD